MTPASDTVRIRRAAVAEAAQLSDLVALAYGKYVPRMKRRPAPMDDDYATKARTGSVFVADDGKTIKGLIVLIPDADSLLIENVAVDPRYQGNGIGRALLSFAENHAREQRLAELRLYTNEAMVENLALYSHLGFSEYDRHEEHGFQRVFFSKQVTQESPTREEADIASVAAALANPSRASIMLALLDGESLSAGSLARRTGLTTSRTSGHLRRLEQLALIASERTGRNRYLRLASREVAVAIDALARIAPPEPESTCQPEAATELSAARTCYDHLAGRLGVAITEALVCHKILAIQGDEMHVTRHGENWIDRLGVDLTALKARKRALARTCLDGSQGRPHLAGALGAELTSFLFAQGLISHRPGSRAITVTPAGTSWLDRELGITH